jgi:glycosyltransferase involved in cell wall biosynthesis
MNWREHARRTAPGNVRFPGNVNGVRTVLHACDVLVMASRTEGMPGVVIEAGLCGVPTVAPQIGALGSLVIRGETGIIAESTSPETIAEAVETLLPIAPEPGSAARKHLAACCSWAAVAPQWAATLTGVATARAAHAAG